MCAANVSLLVSCLFLLQEMSSYSWAYCSSNCKLYTVYATTLQWEITWKKNTTKCLLCYLLKIGLALETVAWKAQGWHSVLKYAFLLKKNWRPGYISHCSPNAGQMQDTFMVEDDAFQCPHNDRDFKLWGETRISPGQYRQNEADFAIIAASSFPSWMEAWADSQTSLWASGLAVCHCQCL